MNRVAMEFYFLVFGNDIGDYEERVKRIGGKVIHAERPSFPYYRYKCELKRIWKEEGPFDIVHTHTLLNNGINCKIFHDLGCPQLISHSHSTESNRKNNIITKVYEYLMKKLIRDYATDYLACGRGAGEYLYGRELFREKGIIVRNGVNFDDVSFDPEVRERLRVQMDLKNVCVIGHVARLADVKNHEFVLEILKELKKNFVNYKYVIVGDGPNKEKIKNKTKELNLEKEVIMLGNREDVTLLQNVFDLVVYPSFYEGIPLALVEAQINGIPCIVSENVSREVQLREKTKFVSLDKSAKEWAQEVREYQYITRENNLMLKEGKQYDIKCSAEKLRQIYMGDKKKIYE